ncbi:MAG: hypothetical protein AB8B67_01665 [Rickettsiaceae bacterium]
MNFYEIFDIEDLTQTLSKLHDERITLSDRNPETANTYFQDLMSSYFAINPNTNLTEILDCIVKSQMQFNISNDQLQNLFHHFSIPERIKKIEDLVKILSDSFGLNTDSQIHPGQKIAQTLIQQSSYLRLEKTLKFLHEQRLLHKQFPNQDNALPSLNSSIIWNISTNISGISQLKKIISIFKEEYALEGLAHQMLHNQKLQDSDILKAFSSKGVRLNLSKPIQFNQKLTEVIVRKNFCGPELVKLVKAVGKHDINWQEPINEARVPNRSFIEYLFDKSYTRQVTIFELLNALIKNRVDLMSADQNGITIFSLITNRLDYENKDNKYFVKKFTTAGITLQDILSSEVARKMPMHEILSVYKDVLVKVDFNSPCKELVNIYTGLNNLREVPATEFFLPTLLQRIFCNINGKRSLDKTLKLLAFNENIDWSQNLNNRSILDKISQYYCQYNIVKILSIAKEYGLLFNLDSSVLIQSVFMTKADSQNIQELIKAIEKLGFKINLPLMTIVFANNNGISLSEAANVIMPEGQLSESTSLNIKQEDLPIVQKVITRPIVTELEISQTMHLLEEMKFVQWNDLLKNRNPFFLEVLNNFLNLAHVSVFLKSAAPHCDFSLTGVFDNSFGDMIRTKIMSNGIGVGQIAQQLIPFNIDWNKEVPKFYMHRLNMSLTQFLKMLGPERIDLLKEVNCTTLVEHLIRIVDIYSNFDNLKELVCICKEIFNFDLTTAKIGSSEEHFTIFLNLAYQKLEELESRIAPINWGQRNIYGTTVAIKLIEGLIGLPSMVENFKYIKKHIDLRYKKNDLGLDLVWTFFYPTLSNYYNRTDYILEQIVEVLDHCKNQQGLPLINVNSKYNEIRPIDLLQKMFKIWPNHTTIIHALRALGSVESVTPILLDENEAVGKIDLSNDRLDCYEPNKKNAPLILEVMHKKYQLTRDQIDEAIFDFKTRDFGSWRNANMIIYQSLTIEQVITHIESRGNVNDRSISWNWKRVIGTIIHIVTTSHDDFLLSSLINCLSELSMCQLGQLLNILYIVQDKILEDEQQLDYTQIDFDEFMYIWNDIMKNINYNFRSDSSKILSKWYFETYGDAIPPESWSSETLAIRGMLNLFFAEWLKSQNKLPINSYHFTVGLNEWGLNHLLPKIFPDNTLTQCHLFDQCKGMLIDGIKTRTFEFFHKAVNSSVSEMEVLFENIAYNPLYFYGMFQFSIDNPSSVQSYCARCKKDSQEKYIKFLELLVTSGCQIGKQSMEFASNALVDDLIEAPQENLAYIATIMNFSCVSVSKIASLVSNYNSEALIAGLTKNPTFKSSRWIETIDDNKHTLLSLIAHIDNMTYQKYATTLHATHAQVWNPWIHHQFAIGQVDQVDSKFGDLI